MNTKPFVTIALILQMTVSCGCMALAQTANDLVGTWTLLSSIVEQDGKTTHQFGLGAKGMLNFRPAHGHFMLTIIGADLPKFVSNNRTTGTPQENKAVIEKSIAVFGTYLVNPVDKTITFKLESATFPNWNATEQKRLIITANRNDLEYVNAGSSSAGGTARTIWKRAK